MGNVYVPVLWCDNYSNRLKESKKKKKIQNDFLKSENLKIK